MNPLALTMGDPAGIGGELSLKTWLSLHHTGPAFVVLDDPARLFNSSLEGNVRRAIDFHEGAKIDEKAFKALIREAVALNSNR